MPAVTTGTAPPAGHITILFSGLWSKLASSSLGRILPSTCPSPLQPLNRRRAQLGLGLPTLLPASSAAFHLGLFLLSCVFPLTPYEDVSFALPCQLLPPTALAVFLLSSSLKACSTLSSLKLTLPYLCSLAIPNRPHTCLIDDQRYLFVVGTCCKLCAVAPY